jgi:benzodiazapine receptor
MSKGKNSNDIISYILLTAPIILGLGSGYFVSRKRIPKVKSYLNPPSWLFGVVWPILYLLLGYSSYLIWNSTNISIGNKQFYLTLYAIQVLLVMSWWPYFVYYPNKFFATVTLILLAIFALVITVLFFPVNNIASYCLVPYVIWLSFASFLTSQTTRA